MPTQLLVSDANVLIDLEAGGISAAALSLDYQFLVPDILYREELEPYNPELRQMGLMPVSLGEAEMISLDVYEKTYQDCGVSRNDLSALVLAITQGCPLLTGEQILRGIGAELGIEVHGTLWIMEQLITTGRIHCNEARAAYVAMKQDGSWLPWPQVERHMRRLCPKAGED